jgi:drug/metabolite transporter (DMT)-like permease
MDQVFMFGSMVFFGLISLTPLYLANLYVGNYPHFDNKTIYVILYVGIAASVISWLSYNYSVFVIGPVKTSIILYLLPVLSSVMGYLFLNEKIYPFHLLGFILIISGIFISNFSYAKK